MMSTEIDPLARLYRALAAEARYVPLDPPSDVRARADRHSRTRVTLIVTTAAAVAAGVVIGTGGLVGDARGGTVVPAPPVSTEVPPARPPTSIPAAAFRTQAEFPATALACTGGSAAISCTSSP